MAQLIQLTLRRGPTIQTEMSLATAGIHCTICQRLWRAVSISSRVYGVLCSPRNRHRCCAVTSHLMTSTSSLGPETRKQHSTKSSFRYSQAQYSPPLSASAGANCFTRHCSGLLQRTLDCLRYTASRQYWKYQFCLSALSLHWCHRFTRPQIRNILHCDCIQKWKRSLIYTRQRG